MYVFSKIRQNFQSSSRASNSESDNENLSKIFMSSAQKSSSIELSLNRLCNYKHINGMWQYRKSPISYKKSFSSGHNENWLRRIYKNLKNTLSCIVCVTNFVSCLIFVCIIDPLAENSIFLNGAQSLRLIARLFHSNSSITELDSRPMNFRSIRILDHGL